MTPHDTGADSADERARIAALLTHYPQVPDGDLDRIHRWFRKGATALDLGLLASDPTISNQYRAYRADHHDRIKPADIGRAVIAVALVLVLVGLALMLR